MTQPAKRIIDGFDALSDAEKREVLAALFRKSVASDPVSDDEFLAAADQVFLDLDLREAKE
jgi:hypothetical protein